MPAAEPAPHQRAGDVEQPDQADRPAAQLERRNRRAEKRHPDRLVGDIGRQMQADKGDVEAADEEPDRQQPEARRAKRLAQRLARRPAARPGRRRPRRRDSRRPSASGTISTETSAEDHHRRVPVVEPVLQHRGERHDRELAERAAGRRDAERDRALCRRRLAADRAEDRAEPGRRHADAAQDVAGVSIDALGRAPRS